MFDTHCVESGLALRGMVRLVPIIETDSGGFEPLAGMLSGDYDAYGGVDVEHAPDPDALLAGLRAMCSPRGRPGRDGRDVWNVLSQDVNSFRLRGRILTYVLLDEEVALVMDAAARPDAVARVPAVDALGRSRSDRDRRLAAALTSWRTQLRPIWTLFGGQYSPEKGEHLPFVRAAREKYGGNAAMLRAIEQNERFWNDG